MSIRRTSSPPTSPTRTPTALCSLRPTIHHGPPQHLQQKLPLTQRPQQQKQHQQEPHAGNLGLMRPSDVGRQTTCYTRRRSLNNSSDRTGNGIGQTPQAASNGMPQGTVGVGAQGTLSQEHALGHLPTQQATSNSVSQGTAVVGAERPVSLVQALGHLISQPATSNSMPQGTVGVGAQAQLSMEQALGHFPSQQAMILVTETFDMNYGDAYTHLTRPIQIGHLSLV